MEWDHSVKGIVWLPLTEDPECCSAEGECFALLCSVQAVACISPAVLLLDLPSIF